MPKPVRPSEEMQRWAVLLEQELISWPKITIKKMFGMKTFYCGPNIFAGVPDKRSFFSPNGVIFKIVDASSAQLSRLKADKRVDLDFGRVQKWYNFVFSSDRDFSGALEWFAEAYESVKKSSPKKQPVKPAKRSRKK